MTPVVDSMLVILYKSSTAKQKTNAHTQYNLCPYSSDMDSVKKNLEHFFPEFTNIYLSPDIRSVSEHCGQKSYMLWKPPT
jgi:hypothetical protein